MAAVTTSNPSKTALQQIFLDRNYFDSLMYSLKFWKYGTKKSVPGNHGNTSIRFFRPRKATRTGISVMGTDYNEGVAPTTKAEVNVGYVDCTLNQRIWYTTISDLELATGIIPAQKLYTQKAGEDMALDYDVLCCNSMFANPAVAANSVNSSQSTLYGSNTSFERFSGVTNTGVSATDFSTFNGLSAAQASMTRAFHIGCMTQLREANVPQINNRYPVLAAPRVIDDMRQDSQWFAAAVFNAEPLKLFPGGNFDLDGGVFIDTNTGWREGATYGTRDDTGANFGVAYIGKDAFGVPTLSNGKAGGSGESPIMTWIDKPDSGNPANQYASLALKTYYGSVLLKTSETTDVPHVVLGRVKSNFVSV